MLYFQVHQESKHLQLELAIKSLTRSRKVLNRMGHCASYSTVEELETELTFEANKNSKQTPFGMKTTPEINTAITLDNFDRFVETKSGKGTLHETVKIAKCTNDQYNSCAFRKIYKLY